MSTENQNTGYAETIPPTSQQRGPTLRPTLLAEAFAAATPTGPSAMGGSEIFKRRRVTFRMPAELCLSKPDGSPIFTEDFDMTLEELDPATEMDCAGKARSDGQVGLLYAKASLNGVNGAPVTTITRDWLWEAIGQGGRMLVVMAFADHLSPSAGEEGKARMTAAIKGAAVS